MSDFLAQFFMLNFLTGFLRTVFVTIDFVS